jgi:CheY-like chemotaxis protein
MIADPCAALAGRTILIAEDEPLIRLLLASALTEAGARVLPAADARQAARLAGAPDLTAAVLDYNLGRHSSAFIGWYLARRGVPFLFYTGHAAQAFSAWPSVPIVPKPAPMLRIVSILKGLTGR